MKLLFILATVLVQVNTYGQKIGSISFKNDYPDVYHLSLIVYTPDGKNQTRVSNLEPDQLKTYSFPVDTEIYITDRKQEAFAMKGNDIKSTGIKPSFIVSRDNKTIVVLSSLAAGKKAVSQEN